MGISLTHTRYEEIKQIVVDLFVRYGVSCVPVNGFELAAKMGVTVVPYSAIPESKRWRLFKKKRRWVLRGKEYWRMVYFL